MERLFFYHTLVSDEIYKALDYEFNKRGSESNITNYTIIIDLLKVLSNTADSISHNEIKEQDFFNGPTSFFKSNFYRWKETNYKLKYILKSDECECKKVANIKQLLSLFDYDKTTTLAFPANVFEPEQRYTVCLYYIRLFIKQLCYVKERRISNKPKTPLYVYIICCYLSLEKYHHDVNSTLINDYVIEEDPLDIAIRIDIPDKNIKKWFPGDMEYDEFIDSYTIISNCGSYSNMYLYEASFLDKYTLSLVQLISFGSNIKYLLIPIFGIAASVIPAMMMSSSPFKMLW